MELDEKKAIFMDCYDALLMAGKIRTQVDFAALLGVSRPTVSLAINGKPAALTDSLVGKAVRLRLELLGPSGTVFQEDKVKDLTPVTTPTPKDKEEEGVFIPQKTLELYTSLARTCETLSGIVAQMQGVTPVKKGFSPDLTDKARHE